MPQTDEMGTESEVPEGEEMPPTPAVFAIGDSSIRGQLVGC